MKFLLVFFLFVMCQTVFSQSIDEGMGVDNWEGIRKVKRLVVENKTSKMNDTIFNNSLEIKYNQKGYKISECYFNDKDDTLKYVSFSYDGQEVCKSTIIFNFNEASSGSQPFGSLELKTISYNNIGKVLSVDKKYESGTVITKFYDYGENPNTASITYKINGEVYLVKNYLYEYW